MRPRVRQTRYEVDARRADRQGQSDLRRGAHRGRGGGGRVYRILGRGGFQPGPFQRDRRGGIRGGAGNGTAVDVGGGQTETNLGARLAARQPEPVTHNETRSQLSNRTMMTWEAVATFALSFVTLVGLNLGAIRWLLTRNEDELGKRINEIKREGSDFSHALERELMQLK